MLARLQREVEKLGMREFARRHRMAVSQVSKAANGDIPIPPRIAEALGYRRVITYKPLEEA